MKETNLGRILKKLRETKGMSRGELSEAVGISESHLRKIEAGHRLPGIQTYQKVMIVLEADIVIKNGTGTVRGDCTERAQKVFMDSTEDQALYLVKILESMAEGLNELTEK